MSAKAITILSILGLILIGGIYGIVTKSNDIEKIKASPVMTTCKIVEHDNLTEYNTNGCWIYFEYTVNGKSYKHCQKYHGWRKEDNFFMGRTFPVVYSAGDPDLGHLLIVEGDYNKLGLVQPDSLKKYNSYLK